MEEKKTRGNKKLLVVLAMILLLVAIFALGGYTFARYISSTGQKATQATVAKWGFVVTANADDLFYDAYNDKNQTGGDNSKATWASPAGNGVKVSADTAKKNIVAPGTAGSMSIVYSGKAEVSAELVFSVHDLTSHNVVTTDTDITNAIKDVVLYATPNAGTATAVHNPVVWDIKENGTSILESGDAKTLVTCIKKLKAKIAGGIIAPNTTVAETTYALSWSWALDNASNTNWDKYDTILGYLAYYQDPANSASLAATKADAITAEDILEGGKYIVYKDATNGITIVEEGATAADTDDVAYTANLDIAFEISLAIQQAETGK